MVFFQNPRRNPCGPRPGSHRLDEFAASYSLAGCTPALPASASPAGSYLPSTSRICKPPHHQGWGIFDRHNGEFSTGIDIYDEPPYLSSKIYYIGVVLRDLALESADRTETRLRAGIPVDAAVFLVCPGGAAIHSEAASPILDLVLGAYEILDIPQKYLVWLTDGPDFDLVTARFGTRADLRVLKPRFDFTGTLLMADLVITKGNRLPLFECEALSIPSLSISSGHNPIDDYRVGQIRSNKALRRRGLTSTTLKMHMANALGSSLSKVRPEIERALEVSQPRYAAAERLQYWLRLAQDIG